MVQRVIAELVKRRTRSGDAWFVGTVGTGGERTRITLFFSECRTNDAGEVVEVWQLRCEPALARSSPFETAPSPARRIGATRDQRRAPTARA